jgi:hypothetical protein
LQTERSLPCNCLIQHVAARTPGGSNPTGGVLGWANSSWQPAARSPPAERRSHRMLFTKSGRGTRASRHLRSFAVNGLSADRHVDGRRGVACPVSSRSSATSVRGRSTNIRTVAPTGGPPTDLRVPVPWRECRQPCRPASRLSCAAAAIHGGHPGSRETGGLASRWTSREN